jgi:hypothetical protein
MRIELLTVLLVPAGKPQHDQWVVSLLYILAALDGDRVAAYAPAGVPADHAFSVVS